MKEIEQLVESRQEDIVALERALVRLNTVNPYSGDAQPGGEKAGQDFLAPILEAMGAEPILFDCPPDIYGRAGILGPKNRSFRERPNLVARFEFGGEGPTIVINGHMDTVGIDNMPSQPLSAEVRDNRIYGRGSSDCKGGLTVGVSAIRTLLELDAPLRGSIVFQSVVDEECNGGGAGTLACFDAGHTGDVAIFVDGHNDCLTLGCGGCLTADVFVEGQEGHAARGNGVSAIEKALVTKRGIDKFKSLREGERATNRVNLGIFRAGQHPAVIPGSAYLSLNAVYDVSEAEASKAASGVWGGPHLRALFEKMIAEAEAEDEWLSARPSRVEWVKDLIPYSQSEDDPWVGKLCAAFTEVTGREVTRDRMAAWSDAAHPAALYGTPTLLYGPSVESTPHTAGEYMEIENLMRATKVIATFLLRELGRGS